MPGRLRSHGSHVALARRGASGAARGRDCEAGLEGTAAGGNSCCDFCGETCSLDKATVDHRVPKSAGGADTPENWLLACYACNQRRAESPWSNSSSRSVRPGRSRSWRQPRKRYDGSNCRRPATRSRPSPAGGLFLKGFSMTLPVGDIQKTLGELDGLFAQVDGDNYEFRDDTPEGREFLRRESLRSVPHSRRRLTSNSRSCERLRRIGAGDVERMSRATPRAAEEA